jgi:transposase
LSPNIAPSSEGGAPGLSLEQTGQLLGVSEGWACPLRSRFIRNGGQLDEAGPGRGGRRRENLSRAEEAVFLAPFLEQAKTGEILVVSEIKQALDERLGRVTALASVYNLLHRHGWRKLAPDQRHPKSDPAARGREKKLPQLLAEIDRQWPGEVPIRLMFQDEARFGRRADVRRCGCPKPLRPLCQAVLTQEYLCVCRGIRPGG